MEHAKTIWEELGLPKLDPRPPWYGYSLGLWSEEAVSQANNATAGDHAKNAEYSGRKGVKVPKGGKFLPLKEKYLADELERFRTQAVKKEK